MENVLERIVADKRISVAKLKESMPLDSFINELTPTTKNLYDTLSQPEAGFILECKKASPSKGLIREHFDVLDICKTYEKYAAGISVLTDEKYFQGKYEYLKTVTDNVSCPVLNKDFFIDVYQVHLGRYYGADAILLMLSVLSDEEYIELANVAKQYNMAILTEISTFEEQQRAINLDAKLIGINNRNLRDLSTDLNRTFDFAENIPEDRIVISESGIYTNAQVRKLAPTVDGFLVGSSVMAKDNIDLACRRLIFGENKICGLTQIEQAQAAKASGAVYGGLIFAEMSPRAIDLQIATHIVKGEPNIDYVGVFVNHDISFVAKAAYELSLFAVQLHGNENQEYIEQLQKQLPNGCQVWKAIPVENELNEFSISAQHYVLDGKNAGSGKPFSWQLLHESEQDLSACLLAGGISNDNINDAIAVQNKKSLFGLDINSGVESEPGKKCSVKINDIFTKIRNY